MPKGGAFEADFLKLILNAVAVANLADNAGSSPLTNLYLALHTSSPGPGGGQNTNEISYTGYARVAIARNSGSPTWTVTGTNPAVAMPTSDITFGIMTGGTGGTANVLSVGTASSGAGKVLWYGTISPAIVVTIGVTPTLAASVTSISET